MTTKRVDKERTTLERSEAAKRSWETRRKNQEAAREEKRKKKRPKTEKQKAKARSKASKKGWRTRKENEKKLKQIERTYTKERALTIELELLRMGRRSMISDFIAVAEMTREDGSKAKERSSLRFHPKREIFKQRLKEALGDKMMQRMIALDIAEETGVPLREVWTLHYSP